ncbi:MAG: SH3 domain-containing protein [Cyanobacteriota bacterium]|nr:SH3 domain-containing protein [Cyanobacteriota bacterium]
MNQNRRRNKSLALFALVAIAFGSVKDAKAIATGATARAPLQIAQNFGNLCQQVASPQGLEVRERPSPNSPILRNLTFNQQVTLAEPFRNIRGPAGRTWTQITFPLAGYVARGFPGNETALINCTGGVVTPPPNPGDLSTNPLCRRVDRSAAPRGIVVRASASTNSARTGGVLSGNQVLLVPNYQLIPDLDNRERRNWVQITAPVPGFISAGTLVMCR